MILVTGSAGLIGRAFCRRLREQQIPLREFDMSRSPLEDTRRVDSLVKAVDGIEGVVHLAAVSRVVWAEQSPDLTEAVNVAALHSVLACVAQKARRPWVIFASSREVYGEPSVLPVVENTALAPLNVYARSKVAGETAMQNARNAGILANIVRFSNVYGSVSDHHDRVIPAFARAAAYGGTLRLDGAENMFDFTHVDDVADGLFRHVEVTRGGEALPPVHFVTGQATTLHEVAEIATRLAHSPVRITHAPSRNYDVARFVGDPARACALLGWRAKIAIEPGFARLTGEFRAQVNDRVSENVSSPALDGTDLSATFSDNQRLLPLKPAAERRPLGERDAALSTPRVAQVS
jgi:nucleoside-diphosphate-sugar epimerase